MCAYITCRLLNIYGKSHTNLTKIYKIVVKTRDNFSFSFSFHSNFFSPNPPHLHISIRFWCVQCTVVYDIVTVNKCCNYLKSRP